MALYVGNVLTGLIQSNCSIFGKKLSICWRTRSSSQVVVSGVVPVCQCLSQMAPIDFAQTSGSWMLLQELTHIQPRIEDHIDCVGKARPVTTLDLLKGYWQVSLTKFATKLSAFVTPEGLYQYRVMPFGMHNAPATFQRMVNQMVTGIEGCKAYIDDVIAHNDSWLAHISQLQALLWMKPTLQ